MTMATLRTIAKPLKWVARAALALLLLGVSADIAFGLYDLRDMLRHPPLDREFRDVRVGMTKEEIQRVLQRTAGVPDPLHYKMDQWLFSGPWYCYSIAFDSNTHVVVAKHRTYPPSCIADVEPRGLILRWSWQKWAELR
ncbi:MAG: hypothetical protein HY234_07315 [Acidobacteria bacterium]|nr:hypothetical protein [Acidobacteriota bacterium]MBI3662843.1 hypothetical protein [Acidobacteriota bacterium]